MITERTGVLLVKLRDLMPGTTLYDMSKFPWRDIIGSPPTWLI